METTLIADSGATKCEWCLLTDDNNKRVITTGINPYFLSGQEIITLLQNELLPSLSTLLPNNIFFYGSGLGNPDNAKTVKSALRHLFPKAILSVETDILAAARAACNKSKGIVCILGTGSNSCYYNGKKIAKNIAGIGYVLGDEGSGTCLGKKVVQHYLYNTFDDELQARFDTMFATTPKEVLENVYRKPFPNRYLASFTTFLTDNRGHYMVENMIEDGLNDFFFQHICKFKESWTSPVHFTGGVAFGFRDVLKELCKAYQFEMGTVMKNPMDGLMIFHQQ